MWLCSFSNTIYWRDYLFTIVYSWLLYCKLVDYIHMGLVFGSILFHWPVCLYLCQYHTVLITIALWYSFKSGSVIPPAFFFFFRVLFFVVIGIHQPVLKNAPLSKYYSKMLFVGNLETINYSFKLLKYFTLPTALKTYF